MPTITGRLAPADKAASDYCYVPFDVPPHIARLDVRYAYSHPRHHSDLEGQGNTLDIGLFDPHGHEFLNPEGFRGWSGSDRSHVWIGETEAETAPGYLAGPISAGRWHVILGLYRIAPEGCDYSVSIEMTPRSPRLPVPTTTVLRVQDEEHPAGQSAPGWYRGDLQAHTHHSDAIGSLATLIATARVRGLDFLAVTDHNTISHVREFGFAQRAGPDVRPLLIPALEVTTYYGHMNVWGVRGWVDFRCRDAGGMNQIIVAAHRQGGLVSVNHPKTAGPPWEYGGDLDFDCIEVWQAPWPFFNTESIAWWESLLKQGRRVVAVGGSDYHQPAKAMEGNPHLPGNPTTWVHATSLTVEGILAGIRKGHVFISADVTGPLLHFSASGSSPDFRIAVHGAGSRKPASDGAHEYQAGDTAGRGQVFDVTCRVQGGTGCYARLVADGDLVAELPVDSDDWTHTWCAQPRAAKYIRAEVIIRNGPSDWVMAACSNPIYF
jgi:hypothetical protein